MATQNGLSVATKDTSKIFNNQWIVKQKVSSGSFGVVFLAIDKNTKETVAIKLEKEENEEVRSLEREVAILNKLKGLPNVPKLYWSGQENNYNIMVLNLLGKDLAFYMKQLKKFSLKTVLMLFDQCLIALENIHNRSVVHRDLKPENILMGKDNEDHMVYIIDFGISKVFRDSNARHISFKEDKPFIGTTRYASIAAHIGHELGRKDDLESLAYVMIFLLKGCLPWQNLQNVSDKDKTQVIGEVKQKTKIEDLCKDLPVEFLKYLAYVKKLNFKSQPDYKYLRAMFQKLGATVNAKYGENDWDWKEQTQQTNQVQQIQQQVQQKPENKPENNNQFVQRKNNKQLSVVVTPVNTQQKQNNGEAGQADHLLIPEKERNQKRNLSLTPSVSIRSVMRKTTGGSFNQSVRNNYQVSCMNRQYSNNNGSKVDFDEEEYKENIETSMADINELEIDEYCGNTQTLDSKLQYLIQTQVTVNFKDKESQKKKKV